MKKIKSKFAKQNFVEYRLGISTKKMLMLFALGAAAGLGIGKILNKIIEVILW